MQGYVTYSFINLLVRTYSYGTDQFSVYTSFKHDADWSHVLTGNLPNVANVACEGIPINTFDIGRSGRYVKVTMNTYYGLGYGLQYVDVNFEESCGKTSDLLA